MMHRGSCETGENGDALSVQKTEITLSAFQPSNDSKHEVHGTPITSEWSMQVAFR